jgi:hypothetical protein
MKTKALMIFTVVIALAFSLAVTAQKPSFSGTWSMDRNRSFGLPPDMQQTMMVTQTDDKIELETRLITSKGENSLRDSYFLDGQEREFTPQGSSGSTPGKGKRKAYWLSNGRGIVVEEETTAETQKGPETSQLTRKWTISNDGELIIDMYIDGPNRSYETKRIFKRK